MEINYTHATGEYYGDTLDFPVIDNSESNDKPLTRAQRKNLRKKQKKKDSKQKDFAFEIEEVICSVEDVTISEDCNTDVSTVAILPDESLVVQETGSMEAIAKRIRTLKKKLKQIDELEDKINLGEINPNREQIDKISKKKHVLEEIELLST